MKWVAIWGNATSYAERMAAEYAKNITLRYPITSVFDGTKIRITLSNLCGNESVTLDKVTIARSEGEVIFPETTATLTFGGGKCVMGAGETATSDPVDFEIKRGETFCVSIYIKDFTLLRSAVLVTGHRSKGYFAEGDCTKEAKLPLNFYKPTNWFYFLNTVDLMTEDDKSTVICYGDSITAQAWADYLIDRTFSECENTAVIRRAVCGTRVLREYECIYYASYGLKGAKRFDPETEVAGARAVIIQHGINDIIHPVGKEVNVFRGWDELPTAEELIEGIKKYIEVARRKGLKVYLGTLLPIYGWRTYAPFREELRCAVNDWMRTTDLADGCIDFAAALEDKDDRRKFAQGYDSGDHLHPSAAAYKKMAEIVPIELLI